MLHEMKKSDQVDLGQVYRQYRSELIAWMDSKYGCGREVARDIYQNTMLTITIKSQQGELNALESNLKTYIYGVAKNKYREYVRSSSRYVQVEDKSWANLREEASDSIDHEDIGLVLQCLNKLGDPCKSMLELYYFHSMSMEEIVEHTMYKNSNTAKNMKYKCLLKLKELFHKARGKEDHSDE